MKFMFKAALLLAVVLLLGAGQASAQCQAIGADTTGACGYVLTINADGSITGTVNAGATPYDGGDDMLVGVVNNSAVNFTGAITLSGTGNGGGIFGFDGDGWQSYPYGTCNTVYDVYGNDTGNCDANTGITFSGINAAGDTGTVNIAGLAAGTSTFFSLEGAPNSITISAPPVVTPEPGTLILLGVGLTSLAGAYRRRMKK